MRKLKTILLIDDDPINNFINLRLLEKLAIADFVKVVRNGKEGIDFIKTACKPEERICPEFIILDNHMPVMDGIEFMEQLNKENFINRDEVVILALAATYTEEDMEKLRNLGVQEFTNKPLSKEIVLEICQRYWALV
jgi:CheY-like chemotaxis protein